MLYDLEIQASWANGEMARMVPWNGFIRLEWTRISNCVIIIKKMFMRFRK